MYKILWPLQILNSSTVLLVFISSAINPQSNMFGARVGMKEPHPLQKQWVSPNLRMARSGQRRQRLKTVLRSHKVGAGPLPLSVKIRSRYWLRQTFSATAVGFPVIRTSRSIASAANVEAHQYSAPCAFSSKVQASCQVLLLPELWACKSIEEWFPQTTFWNCCIPLLCTSSSTFPLYFFSLLMQLASSIGLLKLLYCTSYIVLVICLNKR